MSATSDWVVGTPMSRRYPIYTRGNVGEVFPDPVAPLSFALGMRTNAEGGWRDAFERFGVFDQDEFEPDEMEILGVFGGYCYLNVSISRIFGVRVPGLTPELVDLTLFGEMGGARPYEPRPTDESPEHTARITQTLGFILTAEDLPELADQAAAMEELRAGRPDIASMSDRALVDRTRELFGRWFRSLFAEHLFITYCSMVPMGIVTNVCAGLGKPELAMALVSGVGGVDSAAPSWAMWELGRAAAASPALSALFDRGTTDLLERLRSAEGEDERAFLARFEQFLHEFGSRGPNEWETRCPTWETNPELALTAIDRMRVAPESAAPEAHHEQLASQRETLGAQITDGLAGDPDTQAQFQAALRSARLFLAGRERTKTTVVRLVHEARMMMHELGRRMVAAGHFTHVGDFAMLLDDELDDFLVQPAAYRDVIAQRVARFDELEHLVPPFMLNGDYTPTSQWDHKGAHPVERAASGTELHGISGCPGKAVGRARVILNPFDGGELEPGEVLVAPITDPSWTPLFVPAAAVVVDVGAQLSHAIIVSRELGLPCVVSVTDGTRRIPNGALVEVDGSRGAVRVLEAPAG